MGFLLMLEGILTAGRRRPFMVAGSILVGINLLIIGWTREVGSWFLARDSDSYQTLVIWIAVVCMYLLDFSINAGAYPRSCVSVRKSLMAVQAACRAIIVDTLPAQKQEIGNAWASRMVAGGHLVGYTMYPSIDPAAMAPTTPSIRAITDKDRGFVNLTKVLFFLGDTQLKVICFLSALGLFITVGITCYSVSERVLVKRGYSPPLHFHTHLTF